MSEPCVLCGEPGLKRRVQVYPWKMVCIYVCKECKPRMMEAILAVRAVIEKGSNPDSEEPIR